MISEEIMDLFRDVSKVLNKHEEMIMELNEKVDNLNTIDLTPKEN